MKTIPFAIILALISAPAAAQQGRGRQGGAATARAAAPVDLTGTWVSIVTEDWRWRMRTPPKGDYASVPMTDAARKAADAWDPARDTAAGEQCRSYGAAAIMRVPGRIRANGPMLAFTPTIAPSIWLKAWIVAPSAISTPGPNTTCGSTVTSRPSLVS